MFSTTVQAIGKQYAAYVAAVDRAQELLAQRTRTSVEEKELSTLVACLKSDESTRDLLAAEKRRALEQMLQETSCYASPTDGARGTVYGQVPFEPQVPYNGNEKQLFTFGQSLERLITAGYLRHPRPAEVFSLLIASLEGKLSPEQKAVADNMVNSYGEWLSAATERKGDTLTVYFDPQGLVWNGSQYTTRNFTCSEKKNFPLAAGIPSRQYVDLARFSPELVTALYSRPFQQLPQAMREGNKRAQVYLPIDNQIWPVGRGNYFGRFDMYVYNYGASRGVVQSSAREKNDI